MNDADNGTLAGRLPWVETALAQWMVDGSLGLEDWDALGIVALVSAFAVVIHLALLISPVTNAFLLPLDAVPLVTYTKGYYQILDMRPRARCCLPAGWCCSRS